MFVFPAFNANFKTRKRTFRCCERCRIKRIKCNLMVENFDTLGCESCQNIFSPCSLANTKTDRLNFTDKLVSPENLNHTGNLYVGAGGGAGGGGGGGPSPMKRETVLPDIETAYDPAFEPINRYTNAMSVPLEATTPKLLKEYFNFNLSSAKEGSYQYLLTSHPRAVLEVKMEEDASVYHESGIIIPELPSNLSHLLPKDGLPHFKNWYHYQFLLQIQAFTLSTFKFHFKTQEIEKLLEIYFLKINCIFPIVRESDFWDNFRGGTEPTIIIYAMILLVLRDKLSADVFKQVFSRAPSYVHSDDNYYRTLETFTDELDFKIRQLNLVLESLGDYDKINRLVTMLLISLHYRFDRAGGEQSSQDLTCGINLAFALAIHMKPTKKIYDQEKAQYLSELWWTCYVMDRFNSVTNFRCFFIKHEDFNLDLPYRNLNLLQLVQLAKSFENMLVALYQPFNNVHMKDQNNDMQSRLKIFNAADFQALEFNLCSHEIARDFSNFEEIDGNKDLELYKANYVESTIHLLSRLVNNTIILVSQKGFFNDPAIHNLIPKKSILRASGNVLWYMKKIPESLVLQAPILIFCLLISMSCGLKMKARNILGTVDNELDDVNPSFEIEGYMLELEKFRRSWWVVDDVYKLAKDFIENLTMTEKKRRGIEMSLQNQDPLETKVNPHNTNSGFSIQNILQVAEQGPIDSYSVDGSNFFSGWDVSKIPQYDNFFDNLLDDLFNIDMFSM